jgi:hypothetical protein
VGYRSYWAASQAKNSRKQEETRRSRPSKVRAHDGGSIPSAILGGGIKPCAEVVSTRAALDV